MKSKEGRKAASLFTFVNAEKTYNRHEAKYQGSS